MSGLDVINTDGSTADSEAADPPAAPFGSTGMSSAGVLPGYGGSALDIIKKVMNPNIRTDAYIAGALTPGRFSDSLRGSLSEAGAAQSKEEALKLQYIPVVEAAIVSQQQRQLQLAAMQRQQDIGFHNAALGAVAPLLRPGADLSRDNATQMLSAAVSQGTVPIKHAAALLQSLPDDPNKLREFLTNEVQTASSPFYYGTPQKPIMVPAGGSLVSPAGQGGPGNNGLLFKGAQWKLQTVPQGNQISAFYTNESDPTAKPVPIGVFPIGTSPDELHRAAQQKYGQDLEHQDRQAVVKKDLDIAGFGTDGAPNGSMDAQVEAIHRGEMLVPMPTRGGPGNALRNAFFAKYPNANPTALNLLPAHIKAFDDQGHGDRVTAIGTAVQHMELYRNAMDALKTGNIAAFQKAANFFNQQTGSNLPIDPRIFGTAASHEVATVVAAANVGQGTRESYEEMLKNYTSPTQTKHSIDDLEALMAGRINSMNVQYQRPFKRALPGDAEIPTLFSEQFLPPEALTAMQKHLGKPPVLGSAAPSTAAPGAPTVPKYLGTLDDQGNLVPPQQ